MQQNPGPNGHKLAVVHTLTYVASVQLHHVFALKDATSHEKCLAAAGGAISIIREIADQDFQFLDPIMGVSILERSSPCVY
jgi:hypothetical protein